MKILVKIIKIISIIAIIGWAVFAVLFFCRKNVSNLDLIKKNHFPINTSFSALYPYSEYPYKYKYFKANNIIEKEDGKFVCSDESGLIISLNDNPSYKKYVSNKHIRNQDKKNKEKQKLLNVYKNDYASLEDYLAICKESNRIPLIQIGELQNNTTSVDNLIKIVEKHTNQFILSSVNLAYILKAKQYNKNIPVLYLTPEDNEITKDVVDLYASRGIGLASPLDKVNKEICQYSFSKGYPMVVLLTNKKGDLNELNLNKYTDWKVWMVGTYKVI